MLKCSSFGGFCVGGDGAATGYQVKQLEQQNERLKEALVKYVVVYAKQKAEWKWV